MQTVTLKTSHLLAVAVGLLLIAAFLIGKSSATQHYSGYSHYSHSSNYGNYGSYGGYSHAYSSPYRSRSYGSGGYRR